jgi:eukaryotic-like serine/threonine-protein kinase
VTGQRPFDGADEKQIMDAHLNGTPRPPRLVNRSIPPELNDVILVAIAKDPEQRFQTAAAFQGALARVSARLVKGADVQNAPVSPAADSSPFIGRKFSYVSLNILALIAVGLVAAKMELPKYWHRYNSVQAAPVKLDTPAVPPIPVPAEPPKPVSRRVRSQPPPQPVTASARRAQPASQSGSTQAPVRGDAAQSANGGSAGVQVRMRVLATRVAVASTAIRTLQNEQAVPADILATDQRLHSEMNQAKASLDQNNATAASAELNAAERDLERIETFLRK